MTLHDPKPVLDTSAPVASLPPTYWWPSHLQARRRRNARHMESTRPCPRSHARPKLTTIPEWLKKQGLSVKQGSPHNMRLPTGPSRSLIRGCLARLLGTQATTLPAFPECEAPAWHVQQHSEWQAESRDHVRDGSDEGEAKTTNACSSSSSRKAPRNETCRGHAR